ncbi:MDR family MFS transporter [Bacillus suaedae]|uniref:MFS transporter n=1 Tax=Halalkalibacter suaedae TaxID=2822140 RepID=A0A940WS87_9BACI|nr:MDR family MFS transporter [Bacillus suaedae]MBP3951361.1 MFS transporter [Bacillus suaedae]
MKRTETKRPVVLAAIMLAMFMAAVEATIVATAMPKIVGDLGGFAFFSWVFSSYLLMQVVTIPLYGKLADIFGRKKVFGFGICLFLIGSFICGFSRSMEMLIFSRFVQGIGAGAVQPIATTIVGDMYSKEERAKIQGYLASIWGISAIVGPLLGAFFIEYVNWSWIFWINIPFGILSLIIILIFLQEKIDEQKQKVDYLGAILLFITVATLMFVLVQIDGSALLSTLQLVILLMVSLISLLLFIRHERKASSPIMTLSLWKRKVIRYSNLASFTAGAMLLAISTFLPTYVQGVLGQTPLVAGLTLTVISIGWPISSTIAGKMMLKTGFRVTAVIGGLALLVGGLCYFTLPFVAHPLIAGAGSFFLGVGMGFTTTTFIVSIQSSVDWRVRGEATAMNMFMRQLGGAVGVALLGGLLNKDLRSFFEQNQKELSVEPSINAINVILDESERSLLSTSELELLRVGLAEGMVTVFGSLFILSIITFVFIRLLPKDHNKQEKQT